MLNALKLFFVGLVDTFGAKVLASLGMGFISYAGYAAVVDTVISTVQANFSGIGGDTLSYITLAGFPTGFGIILGSVATRATLASLSKLGKLSPV